MTRGTLLVLRSWSRSQETVSATVTVDFHIGTFILIHAKQSNKRTNGQTNAAVPFRLGAVTDLSCGSAHRPPRCHARKGATRNWVWFSTKPKIHFWFWGVPLRLCWCAWRPYDHRLAFTDALGPSHATMNKEASPPGTFLIVSGSDNRDFHGMTFRCATIVCSAPAPVRTLSTKRSGRLDGDRRPVTAFACNYSDLSIVLNIRRNVVHGDVIILGVCSRSIVVSRQSLHTYL